MTENENRPLTIAEFAVLWDNTSEATVRRYIKDKKIKAFYYRRGQLRISRDEANRILKYGTEQSN